MFESNSTDGYKGDSIKTICSAKIVDFDPDHESYTVAVEGRRVILRSSEIAPDFRTREKSIGSTGIIVKHSMPWLNQPNNFFYIDFQSKE